MHRNREVPITQYEYASSHYKNHPPKCGSKALEVWRRWFHAICHLLLKDNGWLVCMRLVLNVIILSSFLNYVAKMSLSLFYFNWHQMQGLGFGFSVLQTQAWQRERRNDRPSSSDNRRNTSDKPSLKFHRKKKKKKRKQDLTSPLTGIKEIKNRDISGRFLFLLLLIISITIIKIQA